MRWRPSQPAAIPAHPQPVPDSESLRRALLAASWRRDRAVSRRRLAWRWLLWAFKRYGPKLLLVGALLFWAATLNRAPLGASVDGASVGSDDEAPPHSDAAAPRFSDAPGPSSISGELEPEQASARLRPSDSLQPAAAREAEAMPAAQSAPADLKKPTLTFDHWLHSKEP
ncbi:MAG: hypothetical protein Fur0019_05960 [Tibeticola sp.]